MSARKELVIASVPSAWSTAVSRVRCSRNSIIGVRLLCGQSERIGLLDLETPPSTCGSRDNYGTLEHRPAVTSSRDCTDGVHRWRSTCAVRASLSDLSPLRMLSEL